MCLFRSAPATPLPTPAPIQPRNPDVVRESRLPSKKDLLDPDEVAGVEYGTSAKKTDPRGAALREMSSLGQASVTRHHAKPRSLLFHFFVEYVNEQ